jgi:hypothetical protein
MIIARPTVAEERWLLLAARYRSLRAAAEKTGNGGSWKTTTWLSRCLGVLLGLFGMSLFASVLALVPSRLLVGGLVLVATAEWLVAKRRVYRSGIEELLYVCGATAIAAQLLLWSDGNNEALAVVLVATAVLLVGWRLLNPLFTTVAIAGYSLAIALAGHHFFDGRLNSLEAEIACAVLAITALIAGGREWLRPSHDRMLDGLVIIMPWCAFGWQLVYTGLATNRDYWAALALALGFFAVNAFVGVRRRLHAPLIGALGSLACAVYALYRLLPWPMYWKLIATGGVLLVVSVLLDRRLRNRGEGLTSRKIDDPAGLDLLQLAGAAHLTPAPGAAPPAGVPGQGGDFGGGGASGRF